MVRWVAVLVVVRDEVALLMLADDHKTVICPTQSSGNARLATWATCVVVDTYGNTEGDDSDDECACKDGRMGDADEALVHGGQ